MSTEGLKPKYVERLKEAQKLFKERLEYKGLLVEETSDEIGLTISLTQFGLSTIYATIGQDELEYYLDNEVEL